MAKIPHVPPTPSSAPSTPSSGVAAPNAAKPLPIDVELVKAAQASGDEELARAVQLFVEDWKNRGPEKTMGPKQAFTEYVKKVGNDSSLILAQKLGRFMGVNTKMFDQLGGVGPVNAGDAAAPSRPSPPAATQAATPATQPAPAAASQPAPATKGKSSLPGGMKMTDAAAIVHNSGVGRLPQDVAAALVADPALLAKFNNAVDSHKALGKGHFNPVTVQDGKLVGGEQRPLQPATKPKAPTTPAADEEALKQRMRDMMGWEEQARLHKLAGMPPPPTPSPERIAEFEEWKKKTAPKTVSNMSEKGVYPRVREAFQKQHGFLPPGAIDGAAGAPPTTQPTPPTNVQSNLNAAVGNQNIVNGPAVAAPAPAAPTATPTTPPPAANAQPATPPPPAPKAPAPAAAKPATPPPPPSSTPAAAEPKPADAPAATPPAAAEQPELVQKALAKYGPGGDADMGATPEEVEKAHAAYQRIQEASGNAPPDRESAVLQIGRLLERVRGVLQKDQPEASDLDALGLEPNPAVKQIGDLVRQDRVNSIDPEVGERARVDAEREKWGQGGDPIPETSPLHPSAMGDDMAGDAQMDILAQKWKERLENEKAETAKKKAAVAQKDGPPSQEAAKPQAQATPEANPKDSTPPSTKDSPSTWVSWMKRNKLLTATGAGAAGLGAAYLLNKQYPDNRSQQPDPRMPQPGPAGGPGTDSLPPLWSDQLQDESLDDYLHRRARSSVMSGNAPGLPFHVGATAGRYGS